MATKSNKTKAIYWLLALTIGFRTLIVPGLTPVSDEDSPLGFNIAFCENLFESDPVINDQLPHGGHNHSHGDENAPAQDPGIVPLSTHCSVAFMGGIFIEYLSFNVSQYLDLIEENIDFDYVSPFRLTPLYRTPQSRAPPLTSLV